MNEQLHCLQEPGNDYDVFSIKTCKPDKTTVGHLWYKELVNKLYCEPKNEVILGGFLTSVPNENIHLNQPQQQQLAQKKVEIEKLMRNSQLAKMIFETISRGLVHRRRRNKKTKKNQKALRHVSLF